MRALAVRRRLILDFVLILAAVVVSAAPAMGQQTVTIDVFNNDFGDAGTFLHRDPTIQVGDTVRWIFVEGVHSTTSVTGQTETWNSGMLFPPATFDHRFTNAGTFTYYCNVHGFDLGNGTASGMQGLVIVQPVPEPGLVLVIAGAAAGLGCYARRRARLVLSTARTGRNAFRLWNYSSCWRYSAL